MSCQPDRQTKHRLSIRFIVILSTALKKDAASRLPEPSARSFTTPPPSSAAACVDSATAPFSSSAPTAIPEWLWLWRQHTARQQLHAAGLWWLHERHHCADGLSSREECCHGRTGIHGTKRQLRDFTTSGVAWLNRLWTPDQPLYQREGHQALLQRIELLRRHQIIPGALSVEA